MVGMTSTESRNVYLDQVVAQGERLEQDLRAKRSAQAVPLSMPPPAPAAPSPQRGRAAVVMAAPEPESTSTAVAHARLDPRDAAVDVRVTGFGRWKTVVVPPNAFVVHTRRGHAEPLHVGLGVSFRYNPTTDSYLVVPGAMQTILISAYCICRELQGVLVQAYVQWIIEDFGVAYRKLDLSDPVDPMRLVNLQLKELTARLRAVAEGQGSGDAGLGLRIVTVQIKEAVVSSARLWGNLQKPYRSEQLRVARLAEVEAETAIAGREMAAGRERDSQRLDTERALAELRAHNEALAFDRDTAERLRRATREQEDAQRLAEVENERTLHALRLERDRQAEEAQMARQRIEQEYQLRRLTLDHELGLTRSGVEAEHEAALLGLERARMQAQLDNDQSAARLQAKLIDALPDIVAQLPKPDELRTVTIGGTDGTTLAGLVAELGAVLGALRSALPRADGRKTGT
jgi:hypothetical protein